MAQKPETLTQNNDHYNEHQVNICGQRDTLWDTLCDYSFHNEMFSVLCFCCCL